MRVWLRIARLLLKLQLTQLRSSMEYRGDFWIGIAGAILQQLVFVVFLVSFFGHVDTLGGWTVWQVALLYGLTMAARGVSDMFANGIWALRAHVNDGTFDRTLLRPIPPALQQFAMSASITGAGTAGTGVVLIVLGLARTAFTWTWWTVPVLLLAIICGAVISSAINLITNLIAFWEPSAQSSFPVMISLLREFAQFPLDIYSLVLRVMLVFVLPYAVISYFPAAVILGKPGAYGWWALTPLIAAVATTTAAIFGWQKGIRRYQGVG